MSDSVGGWTGTASLTKFEKTLPPFYNSPALLPQNQPKWKEMILKNSSMPGTSRQWNYLRIMNAKEKLGKLVTWRNGRGNGRRSWIMGTKANWNKRMGEEFRGKMSEILNFQVLRICKIFQFHPLGSQFFCMLIHVLRTFPKSAWSMCCQNSSNPLAHLIPAC